MVSKSYFINLLIFLFLLISTNEQQCILGENCPFNQGICVSDVCNCYPGYHTLIDESAPVGQQISCNYKKFSQYTPIILELFMPSIGHFYVGNYWLGLIKLTLLITFIGSSYYLYNKFKLPELFTALLEKIGFGGVLSFETNKKDDDEKDGEENKGEENKEDENNIEGKEQKEQRLRGQKKNNNKPKPKYVIKKQFHGDESDVAENEKKLLEEEDKNNNKCECNEKWVKILFELSGTFISLMYFLDLFLYKLNVYTDGYGVPFA